ncbi:uncharacterized protein [Pithys albifrons albifrons]|uniref:uncharacterized protein n=1 Tax=Pithys albifrons albifrons TaxID=3385563 RepID=UPI003A5D08C5
MCCVPRARVKGYWGAVSVLVVLGTVAWCNWGVSPHLQYHSCVIETLLTQGSVYGSAHQEPWGHGDTTPGSALPGAGVRCPLPQVLLICYKSCWDSAFQVTEELGMALQLRLEGKEEEDGNSDSALEPGQTVVQQQQRGDDSEAVLERLEGLEADVRFLCSELGAEKLLWSSRFLELLREQQSLRQRLQELPWQWNSSNSPELLGEAEDQSASGSEGESPEGRRWMEPLWQPRGSTQPDRPKNASQAQPCPAELQPFLRSRNQSGGGQSELLAPGPVTATPLPRAIPGAGSGGAH